MADSLVIANLIELLGGGQGVVSQLPMCDGAVFTLNPGFSLGAPQPDVQIVESMILNGEVPFGDRSSNRTVKLDITIAAPDRATLAGASEQVMQLIDQELWTLTWTRDGGLPLVFDCFRAEPSEPEYDLIAAQQLTDGLTITFQAFPFGRSDTAKQLTFASPLSGTSAPPSPVTLDSYGTVSSIPQWSQSSEAVAGSHSAKWDPGASPADNPSGSGMVAGYAAGISGGADIAGLTSLSFWAGFGSQSFYFTSFGQTTFKITLTDSSGDQVSFGTTQNCTVSDDPSNPSWTYVTAPIPQGADFDYAAVASYEIVISNYHGSAGFSFFGFPVGGGGGAPQLLNVVAYLNGLAATPVSAGQAASARGAVYNLLGITGTAAAPISLQAQDSAATAFKTLLLHRPGADSPPSLTPFVSVGNGGDTPNGATQYLIPSLVTGQNALFGGTYTIMLVAGSWSGSGSSRTVTVTVYQYEAAGGASSTTTVSRTFTPSTDVTNGMVAIGELTLPYKDIAPDNTQAYFAVSVTDTNTGDRFLDCLFLDTTGGTVWINEPAAGYPTYYVDEPTPDRDIGRVMGSAGTRAQAVSVLDSAYLSGGPLTVDPGNNTLLAYSADGGAPSLAAYYFERFYRDRI